MAEWPYDRELLDIMDRPARRGELVGKWFFVRAGHGIAVRSKEM